MKTLGIGGAFIRVKDLEKMQVWYHEVLKIEFQDWHGAVFLGTPKSCTIFSFFSETSDYFPKEQQVMLNFQIENMEEFLKHLETLKIEPVKEPENGDFGKLFG